MKISDSELQKLTSVMEDKNWSIEEVIKFIEHGPTHSKKVVDVSEWKKLGFNSAQEILANGGIKLMAKIKKQLKK